MIFELISLGKPINWWNRDFLTRILKYAWPFFNIMHERINWLLNIEVTGMGLESTISYFVKKNLMDLTLYAPTPQNGQTHSNNLVAICRRIVWLCLTILWDGTYRIKFQSIYLLQASVIPATSLKMLGFIDWTYLLT